MMRFLRATLCGLALAAVAAPLAAQSSEGPWLIRVRALSLTPADKSDAIGSLSVPADSITVSSKVFPELDIAYFLTSNIAAELVLTYPQSHDVELSGTAIGSFKQLPPTLMLQYHFLPAGTVRPYIGAGVNLTLLSDVMLTVPGVGDLDLEDNSIGWAAQVGADVQLSPGFFLNFDAKKAMIRSDVLLDGSKVSAVEVDPWLLSVGIGRRF
jgi:outer membrane protein